MIRQHIRTRKRLKIKIVRKYVVFPYIWLNLYPNSLTVILENFLQILKIMP